MGNKGKKFKGAHVHSIIKRKRMRIWGKKTTTEPTPAQMPSINNDRNQVSARTLEIQDPETSMRNCIPSMSGTAQVKID